MRSENGSDFSSKTEAFLSFVFIFGLILVLGYAAGEFLLWLLSLFLTADH